MDTIIDFTRSLGIYENLQIDLVKDTTFGSCLIFCYIFCLFLFSPILSHQSALRYFGSGDVDYRTRIRVLPSGFIIYKSRLLLMQYLHRFSLRFLDRYEGSFRYSAIHCSSEDNITWWLLTTLFSQDSHSIIHPDVLYLNICNCAAWYLVDFFSLGSRRYLDGGSTCLGICG